MFVTIQHEKINPTKKEMNKAVTMLKLPDVCSYAANRYVFLSLTNRKSSVHLHALYSPRTALRTFTPSRDQLVICGQYDKVRVCSP
jgi:muramidase (phage lysozyme)